MHIKDLPKDIERIILMGNENSGQYFLFDLNTKVNCTEVVVEFSLIKEGIFKRIENSDITILYSTLTVDTDEAEELAKILRLIIEGKGMKIIIKNNNKTVYKS